jgi:hypothetical protein
MKFLLTAAATLSLAIPTVGSAQVPMLSASFNAPISTREAHTLAKSANSSTQYLQLASYFHEREADYLAKAEAERMERNRRFQIHAALYKKFPNPVDSAEALYDSYVYEANHAALQARHYQKLASAQAQ